MELIIILVILGLILVLGFSLVGLYNGLVRGRLRVREAWSGIDVQLKRRSSLIPNLVETVKGYAAHEQETLENVTRARSALDQAGTAPAATAPSTPPTCCPCWQPGARTSPATPLTSMATAT